MTVLAPYRDRLLQWLELDARRAQRDRRTAVTDTTLRNAALTLGCAPR
jgi:hypothetical protein